MVYEAKRKDRSYLDGTIMLNSRLNAWPAAVMRCLVNGEKRGGNRQKEYDHMYAKMVQTTTRKLITNFRSFAKRWAWDEVTMEEDGLSTLKRKDAVMGISKSATSGWTLRSHLSSTVINVLSTICDENVYCI